MARIPASSIPNAPQGVAPSLRPGLPGLPQSVPVDVSGAALDTGSMQRAQGILDQASSSIQRSGNEVARATAANKQDLLDVNDFTGGAKATDFAGAALIHAGGVALSFADKMMRAKESMDMTRVDGILRDARDAQALYQEQNPNAPHEWNKTWNERMPDVQSRIEALNVSPRIRGEVSENTGRFWSDQSNRFMIEATHKSLSDANSEAKGGIQRALDEKDYAVGAQLLRKNIESGVLSKEEGDSLWEDFKQSQRETMINTAISADPKTVMEHTETALKDGGIVKGFEYLHAGKDPVLVRRVHDQARAQFNQYLDHSSDQLQDDIYTGKVTKPEQVREFGERNDLPEKTIQANIKAVNYIEATSPEGHAKHLADLDAMHTVFAQYDPTKDPESKQATRLIDSMMSIAGPGERGPFRDQLRRVQREGRTSNDELKGAFFKQIDDLGKMGLFTGGVTGRDEQGNIIKGKEGDALDLTIQASQYKAKVQDFLDKNPNMPADKAKAQFNALFEGSYLTGSAAGSIKPSAEGWYGRFLDFSKEGAKPVSRDVFQKAKENMSGFIRPSGAGAKPAATPTPSGGGNSASLDAKTIDFVKGVEGFKPGSFSDYAQTSIGYGTRAKPGEKTISKEEADARLKQELSSSATRVDKALAQNPNIKLNTNQRAALISFDFNTGDGDHLIATSKTLDEIAARLPTWNKVTEAGKKVVSKGLVNRRAAELALFTA